MTSRHEMLARIRAALTDVPSDERPEDVPVPRAYHRSHADSDLTELFLERAADYRATVRRCAPRSLPETIGAALAAHGATNIVVPDGFPADWLPHLPWRSDRPALTLPELKTLGGALTTATIAIAVTGTLVLDSGPGQGRRALTLIPDYHLCVVRASQIVADVPDALAALDPTRPLTWISGPSATSDIELDRVEGVHGPRSLDILIVEDTPEH
ncbi:LUD domain-containing protein [Streptomyces sp. BE20]|uniref:LutC/YkgG family protein n=1 Tax=unclassified Streptomyces TaxID=2593676 RepID=UPI002E793316|nr:MULTISPECIES: LUD domain-containing protein [unclassified Streptomyces]MED7948791.1 LUD domain-containing protein [Streptomyces sp. BE303]MEE1821280.1 LUD domain-containing protein [Streptomyces sp. BE20]